MTDTRIRKAKTVKLWLRQPRYAWRNDGGEIPRRFRGRCRRNGTVKTVVIAAPLQRVPVGWWIVQSGSQIYGFSPADMHRLYSRVPL